MQIITNNLNRDTVVSEYKALVYSLAHHYKNRGLALDDLLQEGMIGLLEACQRFDNQQNVQFSTYATYWIKKYMLLAISTELKQTFNISNSKVDYLQDTKTISEPCFPNTQTLKMDSIIPSGIPVIEKRILILSYKKNKTIKEIAVELNLTPEKVKQIRTKALRRIKKENPQGWSQEGC